MSILTGSFTRHVVLLLLAFQNLVAVHGNDFKWKWEVWEEIPAESFHRVYLFNVTNPEEFEGGAVPTFQEIGPYVFTERRHKVSNHAQSEDPSLVSLREVKSYEFVREKSVGSEDDLVTIVNVPLLTFGKILGAVPFVGPNFFKSLVKAGERLTRQNEKVGNVFYYGMTAEPYIRVLQELQPGEPVPEQFSEGRFGLFKGRNGTDTGVLTVETGSGPNSQYGKIRSWKGQDKLSWWAGEACNAINGTTGSAFDPKTLTKFFVSTFDPDACRSLQYSYHGRAQFESIRSWKYVFSQEMLEDPRKNKNNMCFCTNPGEEDEENKCYKRGLIDLGPCREGAPLVLSYPHFYDADPEYATQVQGMSPQKDVHESFMIIEPKTGTVLRDVKRFQLNIQMKRTPSLTYLKNASTRLLPVFWSEKTYNLDSTSIAQLKEELKHSNIDDEIDPGWRGTNSPPTSSAALISASAIYCIILVSFCFQKIF